MKIAVIGAGPGGLVAAMAAVGQGYQVDLLEQGRVGESIVCESVSSIPWESLKPLARGCCIPWRRSFYRPAELTASLPADTGSSG